MNTERESNRLHNGVFRGIKLGATVHDPRRVSEFVHAQDYKLSQWREYMEADEHYFDIPFILTYGVTSAVELGVFATAVSYVFKTLL